MDTPIVARASTWIVASILIIYTLAVATYATIQMLAIESLGGGSSLRLILFLSVLNILLAWFGALLLTGAYAFLTRRPTWLRLTAPRRGGGIVMLQSMIFLLAAAASMLIMV